MAIADLISLIDSRDSQGALDMIDAMGPAAFKRRPMQVAVVTAAKHNEHKVLARLLARGASAESTQNRFTALGIAANRGRAQAVSLLLANGAAVDRKHTRLAQTPLIAACEGAGLVATYGLPVGSHRRVVSMLLRAGADVNAMDGDRRTAISYASGAGDLRLFRMLREAGADPLAHPEGSLSPLYFACDGVGRDEAAIVKELIELGADMNEPSRSFGSPLEVAIRTRKDDVIKFFLGRGADPSTVMKIAMREYKEAVPLIQEWSVRVRGRPKRQRSAVGPDRATANPTRTSAGVVVSVSGMVIGGRPRTKPSCG